MNVMTENAQDQKPAHVRYRDQRKRLKLTQRQVAERAGIGLRTYQLFEKGETTPQPANMAAIAAALGIDLAPELRVAPPTNGDAPDIEWPADIDAFVSMMGAFLITLDEDKRRAFIHDLTRWIVGA